MLRVVGRRADRPADVVVEAIRTDASTAPVTRRAVPHPHANEPSSPSSIERALDPLDEAVEAVHTGELLIEPEEPEDRTPVTSPSPWQRLIPPPLPESN